MSVLYQFKKPGGFKQLLYLFETSEPQKQASLLLLVAQEDPGWAHLLQMKLLRLEKIFTWPKAAVAEALSTIPPALIGQLFFRLNNQQQSNIEDSVSARTLREMREYLLRSTPTEQDTFTAGVHLIRGVRGLEAHGIIKMSEVDPELVLDEKIAV